MLRRLWELAPVIPLSKMDDARASEAMGQSISGAVEHRVRMPAHRAAGYRKGATLERLLNGFVRVVAFIERVGNALGTLAFTWATVVLLGGYPTELSRQGFGDFWCTTTIVFLEAIRVFSRDNKLDYHKFFHTKGAFRRFGWNGLIVIIFISILANYQIVAEKNKDVVVYAITVMLLIAVPPLIAMFQFSGALKFLPKQLRRVIAICSPLAAILLMIPLIALCQTKNKTVKWMVFVLLFIPVLLTISKVPFPIISRLVDSALGAKKEFCRRLILNLSMVATVVMLLFMPWDPSRFALVLIFDIYAFVVVSFGNLQIPATIARIVLALLRLVPHDYDGKKDENSKRNLEPSLQIFYGIVLSQGILYAAACVFEVFSFIPRRHLARRSGLRSQWGKECVSLYYAYAFEKSMEGDVLASKNISLNNFAIHCLNTDTPKKQLHGIRLIHSLLLRKETKKQLFSRLTNSTKEMARLIEMLAWSSPEETTIRLFAAKVTAELATSLLVITIPGTVQVVSSLLDYGNQQQRANPLLSTDGEHEKIPDPIQNIDHNHEERLDACQDTGNLLPLETREDSTQQVGTAEQQRTWKMRCWQRIVRCWSVPQEGPIPLTEQDLLPALGMSILDGLAGCDQDNCVEISRASGLIPKIISFTGYGRRSDTMYTDTHQREVLMASSLKLLHSLTSIHGEIGVTLRNKVSKSPFLLRNLADVLGDSMCSQELKIVAAGILRNLAIDGDARQAIGRNQVIISRLMHAFLTPDGPSSAEPDRLLRKVAGQALAMLTIDNVDNCRALLREPEYEFVKELTGMIHVDRYRCGAASLLQNICRHARPELTEPDRKELFYSSREVLERIMDAEGVELEILIGLSSQICQVIPGDFAHELEQGQIREGFVKRLVDVLNANMEPSADCPGIRRVILEQAVSLVEYDSRYAHCFKDRRMKEALSMVEETASDVENYSLFLGDAGLIETSEPLPSLVARAKQLLSVHRT